MTARLTSSRAIALAIAVAAALGLAPGVPAASADPQQEIAAARAELTRLNERVGLAVESYNESQLALIAAARRAAAVQTRLSREAAGVAALRRQLGSVATSAYITGGVDPLVELVNAKDPTEFLARAGMLAQVARSHSGQLLGVKLAVRRLTEQQTTTGQVLAEQARLARQVEAQRLAIQRDVARQRVLLDKLVTKEERRQAALRAERARQAALRAARLAREAAARAAAAERARARASRTRSTSRPQSTPTYFGPAVGRAEVAVREAYRQLGKPYEWAAEGPDSFDCSGLTMWVWQKAGVSLPHSSRAQFNYGRHVSIAEIRPGDLTFYGSPIHHVGIYIGDGKMISAPQTGDVVKIQSAFRRDYAGAVRL